MSDIDDYLTYRTEQAVLGALLAGTDPVQAGPLGVTGFADPVHQAIYLAFTVRTTTWAGRLRDQAARITSRQVQGVVAYVDPLPGLCPDGSHLDIYAELLRVARHQREVAGGGSPGPPASRRSAAAAGPGQQLEGASQWLSSAAREQHALRSVWAASGQAPQAPNHSKRLDPATKKLSQALRAAARSRRRRSRAREAGAAAAGPVLAGDGTAKPPLRREDLQEAVLADLMRHPGDGRALVRRVPLNVFTRGPLQDLYRLIALPIAAGKPVDWLITAWQARKQELSARGSQPAPGATASESLVLVAERLGAMRTERGTAVVIGRALLGDYEVSMAFGAQWTRQRELNWAAAGRPAVVGQPASPEPAVTPAAGPPVASGSARPAQQQSIPAGHLQARGQRPAAQPAPGPARSPGPAGHPRQGQPVIQRPAPAPGDGPGQQPRTGPVAQ
jgi:hypothetical protein